MTEKFIPVLADLKEDIAGPIPLEVIQRWLESDQSDQAHEDILKQFERRGTIVSSDSAGLSKLSQQRSLMEVMRLVNDPKEIIFAHGKAVGGAAVGVWAADNTQMFYDASIDVNDVVGQMVLAQQQIGKTCEVKVGIGLHAGVAYEIGGGLYGTEADQIEEFTEEETVGGEIACSATVAEKLRPPISEQLEQRGKMFRLNYEGLELKGFAADDPFYPTPFHRTFHQELRGVEGSADFDVLNEKYLRDTIIILVRVFHGPESHLLNDFLNRAGVNTILYNALKSFSLHVVKANGALAILETDQPSDAVAFAMYIRKALRENGYIANVGVSKGDTLIFDLENGGKDLAGLPVNIASKLAEDTDERGGIFVHNTVDVTTQGSETFTRTVSGVEISGAKLL